MADQILTLTYSTTTQLVTASGLTALMGAAMLRFLIRYGIDFSGGSGWLVKPTEFTAERRAHVITKFNDLFDQDPNPQHATDNFTLVLTAA